MLLNMQFIIKNTSLSNINTEHENKNIKNVNSVKFLGITIDSTLSWKQHIDTIISKIN
jgi:hypothetical protein